MKNIKIGELLLTAVLVALVLAVMRQLGKRVPGPIGGLLKAV